jgi:hypothetical protein
VPIQIVFLLAFVAFALFYGASMKRKRAQALGPALRGFLERTGYRYAPLGPAPLDQHVAHGEAALRDLARGFDLHMVRDFHGAPIHNHQAGRPTADGWASSMTWRLPLAAPPHARFQLADRSLTGLGKAVREAFSNTQRRWSAVYPIQVALPAELDRRFLCYSDDPIGAQRALAAPGLAAQLLACTEVDLVVRPDAITFSDPFAKNLNAALGSAANRLAMGSDPAAMMHAHIPVHDRIAQLLVDTARAVA